MTKVKIKDIVGHWNMDIVVAVTLIAIASEAVAGGSATTTMGVSAIVPRMCFDQSDPYRPVDRNSELDPMGKSTGRICNYPVNPGSVLINASDPAANALAVETNG